MIDWLIEHEWLPFYSNHLSDSFESLYTVFSYWQQTHYPPAHLKPNLCPWAKTQPVYWVLPQLSPNRQQVTTLLVACVDELWLGRQFVHLQRSLIEMGPWTAAIWMSLSLSVSTSSPVLMLTGWLCYSCALMCEEPADSVFAEQARHQGLAAHSSLPRSECG